MTRIWSDNPAGLYTNVPVVGVVNIGNSKNPVTSLAVKDLIVTNSETYTGINTAKGFNLLDGADKNTDVETYAAGTAYALTATSAALTFGTTSPVLTFVNSGTYLIFAKANLEYAGATFAASRVVTLKLRRTNNTAADLTNGSTVVNTAIVTTVTAVLANSALPVIKYVATAGDIITIFGDVSVVPTAGALNATEASIVAMRLHA